MPALDSAAIKRETLGLSLDPAWRADPDMSPVDTGASIISGGRVGNDVSVDEDVSSHSRGVVLHTRAHKARTGRTAGLRNALQLLKSIDGDETD